MAPVMCFVYMFLLSCFVDGRKGTVLVLLLDARSSAKHGRMPESCACTIKSFEWDRKIGLGFCMSRPRTNCDDRICRAFIYDGLGPVYYCFLERCTKVCDLHHF
uniref:Putative secreted protein n=1 Tax=Ixodes ricinus TaxID=34613 RepID=A0A6B0UCX9_IXORI